MSGGNKSASLEVEGVFIQALDQANSIFSEAELNDLPKLLLIQFPVILLSVEGLGTARAVAVSHPLPQLP